MERIIALAFCAVCGFAAAAADWTYTITSGEAPAATSGTITDGEWTFAASVAKNSTDITVGAVSADPGADATLDFTKPITDGSTIYTLVTLNPNFNAYANKANLTQLKLPASGLTKISTSAFHGCTSLTNVVPLLPDTVTEVSVDAFNSVPVEQALSLKGVTKVYGRAFKYSSVTSVVFGAALKELHGGWGGGCFDHCQKLKTITFDPGMSGGKFASEGVFAYCSALEGSVDLTGFTWIYGRMFYSYGGKITKVAMSSDITHADEDCFLHLNSVKEITFTAGPPKISTLAAAFRGNDNLTWKDVYIIVPEEYKDDWAPYCENGVINDANSYLDPKQVSTAKTRNLYLIYRSSGTGGEKGYWVYDGTHVADTNEVWKFEATLAGTKSLTVGSCVKYPNVSSTLDFSQKVTDANGNELMFVSLSTGFGSDSTAAASVAKLLLPTNGLASIAASSFAGCVNLTEVTPFLPDSITTLGSSAFSDVPFSPGHSDVKLLGITVAEGNVFRNSKVESATFGPGFKSFSCGWNNGMFYGCSSLTNVTFDPKMTGGYFTGYTHGPFEGCSKIRRLDLSGFGNLAFHYETDTKKNYGRIGAMSSLGEIVIGTNVSALGYRFFGQLTALTNVVFLGAPPKTIELPYMSEIRSKMPVTSIHRANRKLKNDGGKCWLDYAANGQILQHGSTWSTNFLETGVSPASRPLLTIEPTSFMLILR